MSSVPVYAVPTLPGWSRALPVAVEVRAGSPRDDVRYRAQGPPGMEHAAMLKVAADTLGTGPFRNFA